MGMTVLRGSFGAAGRGVRGRVANVAKSRLRLDRLRRLSEQGATLEEAAESVGMAVGSVRNLLRKHEGSTIWPLKL